MRRALLVLAGVGMLVAVGAIVRYASTRERAEPGSAPQTPEGAEKESPMDPDDRHWALIEQTTPAQGPASDAHIEALTDALKQLSSDEILAFYGFVERQVARAYHWDLWAVAYVAMHGCSDDGFEYFRRWLVAHGKEYFERALQNPERAVDALEPGDYADGELFGQAPIHAYEAKTGEDFPWNRLPLIRSPRAPAGTEFDDSSLARRFPELAKRFGYRDE